MSPLASARHVRTVDLPRVHNALRMPARSTHAGIHQAHFTEAFAFVLSQWRD